MLQMKVMFSENVAMYNIFKLCEVLKMTVRHKLLLKLFEPIANDSNLLFKAKAMPQSIFKNFVLSPSYVAK